MRSGIKSGRPPRSLSLILASIALVALNVQRATSAIDTTARPTQPLVSLLTTHAAWARPTVWSPRVGLVPARTPLTREQTVLPLLAVHGNWLEVRLPGRPNGHTGWIRRRATRRSATVWHLVVNTSTRQVVVFRAGRAVKAFMAVVGKPSTPTPAGQFFIEETIALGANEAGAPYALALSARSTVLQEFDGGPGQIAVHGLRNVGGVPGTAVSHGCVRVSDEAIRWLAARLDPGVPVTITRYPR